MELHHLHVVNYDPKPGQSGVIPNEYKAKLCEECIDNGNSKKSSLEVLKEVDVTSKSKLEQVKDVVHRFLPSVRSMSLNDIRKRLKKCDSLKNKLKLRNRVKCNRLKLNIRKHGERKESKDDIKVLYTSQRFGEVSEKKPGYKTKRIAIPCDKRHSKEVFSTQSVTKLRNSICLYYQTGKNRNLIKTDNNLMNRNNNVKKSQSVISKANHISIPNNRKRHDIYYNLVDFSKSRKLDSHKCNGQESVKQRPFIEQTTIVAPAIMTDLGDKRNYEPCKVSKALITETACVCVPTKVDKKCGCYAARSIMEEKNVVASFFKMLLTFLKYVLLGLTVIAWSPCIIVAFLCWFLFSPLTPDDVRADEVVPACLKCRNSFFSRLVGCITRLYGRIVCAFEAVKRSLSLNTDQEITPSPRYYSSVGTQKRPRIGIDSQPNPDKKYVLYHSQQRGWLMKPMRCLAKLKRSKQKCNIFSLFGRERPQPHISPNKKTVSFWDSHMCGGNERYSAVREYKQSTTTRVKRCHSCSCVHEIPAVPSTPPLLVPNAPPLTVPTVAPLTNTCKCPKAIIKTTKSIMCPIDINKDYSLDPSLLIRQPPPRRIYGACPHHKPVPYRPPKSSYSTPYICGPGSSRIVCRPRRRSHSHMRPQSPSPSQTKSPSRSQTKSPSGSRKKSPSRSKTKSPPQSQTKSPSPSQKKSPSRSQKKSPSRTQKKSPSRSQKKSPSRTQKKSPSPSRSRSRSPSRSPSRSSSRSRSRSPSRSPSRSSSRSRSLSPSRSRSQSRLLSPSSSRHRRRPRDKKRQRPQQIKRKQEVKRSRSPQVKRKQGEKRRRVQQQKRRHDKKKPRTPPRPQPRQQLRDKKKRQPRPKKKQKKRPKEEKQPQTQKKRKKSTKSNKPQKKKKKKYVKKKARKAYCQVKYCCRNIGRRLGCTDYGFQCKNLYLSTLTKKPCFWVYQACPNMYPFFLTSYKMCENCCFVVLFICAACVWCPIFLCCYFCFSLICDFMCCC